MPFCTECGKKCTARQFNITNKMCNECGQSDDNSNSANGATAAVPVNSGDEAFWSNMNRLLDSKFKSFEQTIKDSIMGEVKQITDPMTAEVDKLKKENKQLKTEVALLKTKDKEHDEKLEKGEKALKERQNHLHKTIRESDPTD